jgi:hypothetical protein
VLTLEDLANRSVLVDKANVQPGPPPPGACVVDAKPEGKKLRLTLENLGREGCTGLVGNPPERDKRVWVTVDKNPSGSIDLVMSVDVDSAAQTTLETDGKKITTELPKVTGKTIYWSDGNAWFKQELAEASNPPLPDSVATLLSSGKPRIVFTNFDTKDLKEGVAIRATLRKTDGVKSEARKTESANADDSRPVKRKPPRDWCPRATGKYNGYTVCLDLYTDVLGKRRRQVQVFPDGTNHILRPNRAMRVFVLHPKDGTVSISLGGEEGIFVPTDKNQVSPPEDGERHGERPPEPDFDVTEQEFGPRLPGTANLTISMQRPGQAEPASRVVEFLVEQTYLGAVRLGVAVVFGGAVDRGYEARQVSGSPQAEVVATTKQTANLELVLGYSAYLTPRAYANTNWFRFEPYVGIGVLNDSPTGLETLKSLHAGIEWEPTPNFAIALTGVVRRVTRLQDGIHVGSPVTGSVPTNETIGLGGGVVFNLSPEFFRVAKSSGSSFFE